METIVFVSVDILQAGQSTWIITYWQIDAGQQAMRSICMRSKEYQKYTKRNSEGKQKLHTLFSTFYFLDKTYFFFRVPFASK